MLFVCELNQQREIEPKNGLGAAFWLDYVFCFVLFGRIILLH